ncbi:MAG: MFS transporter [Alphaproteobacteria bacterium]|nr:MFS transporter [Alphaproteobacteria bacterium]
MKRVVVSGMIGNGLEWFDYALYGHFATIIAAQFFPPSEDSWDALLITYGVFAAGFVMRPLGAILFGWIGDTFGRRRALAISILMMAIPTACLGLLPTYAQIGFMAPILLTLIRLLQGLSLGGEFSGSVTFIVEHAPMKHRGLAGSTTKISMCIGILLGSLAAGAVTRLLPPEDVAAWGWRIPFVLGLGVGLVGLYIRSFVPESPVYLNHKEQETVSEHTPVAELFRHSGMTLLKAVGIYQVITIAFYIVLVFMVSYMQKQLGYSLKDTLTLNTVALLVMMASLPAAAAISDRVGRKPVMVVGGIGFLLTTIPMFLLLQQQDFAVAAAAIVIMSLFTGIYLGPCSALLVEIFPTRVRYTGMALALNVSAAVFGGTAPWVCSKLLQTTQDPLSPAYYITATALLALVVLRFLPDRYREPLT